MSIREHQIRQVVLLFGRRYTSREVPGISCGALFVYLSGQDLAANTTHLCHDTRPCGGHKDRGTHNELYKFCYALLRVGPWSIRETMRNTTILSQTRK